MPALKKLLLALLLVTSLVQAQEILNGSIGGPSNQNYIKSVRVSELPTIAPPPQQADQRHFIGGRYVRDGSTSTDCTVGGGSNLVFCVSDGASYTGHSADGGGSAPVSSVFGRIGAVIAQAGDYLLSMVGLSGWVTPIQSYHAAGVITTTTGSITTGTNQLTVASASGWSVGMGIAIAGAVSGGSELGGKGNGNVCVGSISTLTFSLITCGGSAVNATATVAGAVVNHDDTYALRAALTSGKNVSLSAGNYNIHDGVLDEDMLTLNLPIKFVGDGVGQSTIYKRSTNGSVIRIGQNGFGANGEGVTVSDIAILMGSGFTPVNGAGVYMASSGGAGTYVSSASVNRMLIIGQCNGIFTGLGVGVDFFNDSRIYGAPSGCAAGGGGIRVDTASPGGDISFNNIQLTGTSTTVVITQADTNLYTNLKVNGGDIRFNPISDGAVIRQRFINTSVEGAPGAATCGINFINHVSDQVSFTAGGVGLQYTNGICPGANLATELSIIGMKFYGLTGYGLSQNGGSSTVIGNTFQATSGAVNYFGSAVSTIVGNIARFGSGTFVNANASANDLTVGLNKTTLANTIGAGTICKNCFSDATFTVATLPACNAGMGKATTTVSDAAASPVYNAIATGSGSLQLAVRCDGTNWRND